MSLAYQASAVTGWPATGVVVAGPGKAAGSTRQVPPLVPPVCRTGALLVSYVSLTSYGPIESGRRESNPLILGGSQVCDHQHFARRPTKWSGRPGSNRHQRVGNAPLWPLSYIHVDAETGLGPVRDSCPTALQAAAFGYLATRRQLRGWGESQACCRSTTTARLKAGNWICRRHGSNVRPAT